MLMKKILRPRTKQVKKKKRLDIYADNKNRQNKNRYCSQKFWEGYTMAFFRTQIRMRPGGGHIILYLPTALTSSSKAASAG